MDVRRTATLAAALVPVHRLGARFHQLRFALAVAVAAVVRLLRRAVLGLHPAHALAFGVLLHVDVPQLQRRYLQSVRQNRNHLSPINTSILFSWCIFLFLLLLHFTGW